MEELLTLITGRWQSQCLYAAIKTGIIDALDNQNRNAGSIASELSLNEENVYRLLRALSSTKVVTETENREFSLTDKGKFLAKSHPQSLRDMVLWEESPELVQLWLTLPDVVKTGKFVGMPSLGYTDTWDFLEKNPAQGLIFQNAMTSYSMGEAGMVVAAYDFSKSGIQTLVDVGGGHGLLVCSILKAAPSLKGAVFELPATLKDPSLFWASKLGVADRCEYIPGDFFATIPEADGYIMKHILHDWDDQKSIQILQNISKSAKLNAKLFIAEAIISPPGGTPKIFDNHFDIHMMVAVKGKERTLKEFIELLDKSGWKFVAEHRSIGHVHLVEAVKI